MEKIFNITGICRPAKHYMADVSNKMAQTMKMVERGDYFIINRPRQYGKTTTLFTIEKMLAATGKYVVFNISFEGIGDDVFENEKVFAPNFLDILADKAAYFNADLAKSIREVLKDVDSLKTLSQALTQIITQISKPVVLLIDEVDKSSNNQLFVSFLAMLRNKYLEQDRVKTFHAIILAGVHDIKSLKLKIRPDVEQKYNSPWNIAAEFKVDMNLQVAEIKPMLAEYARDKNVKMDTQSISERLFYYTSGYPFLVSKLCKMVDEDVLPNKTNPEWTSADIDLAVADLVKETNTNFDSLIKNIEAYPDLYELVYRYLIDIEQHGYSVHDPIVNLGLIHGIFKNGRGLTIHNRIYEEVLYDYLMSKAKAKVLMAADTISSNYRFPDNTLNMETVLTKFQAFMREPYSRLDRNFLERQGRLVFLAFIKPIINGSGYDFKEPQISEERRLDVVITFLNQKYIAELKLWRGEKAHAKGLLQLADYLQKQALTEGYLIVFDHSETKEWRSEWATVEGKKIFTVWV
jgi:hypothetical protein